MLVIDASALVDALLVAGSARARLSADNLHAPELVDPELLSVLRRLVLANKLLESQALQALSAAARLGLRRQLQAPLLTADARLARAPGLRCSVEVVA